MEKENNMEKKTTREIIYVEPADYFPKHIRDEVFGTGKKKEKVPKKTDKKK